jgi:lipoprotein-releasing system permease protein
VTPLDRYVIAGSLDDLDDDSVILSAQLAASIGATVGDTIEIVLAADHRQAENDEVFLPRQVRVVGIFEIGNQQLDSSTVYCTLRLAQDLYGLGHGVHGINVRLKPGVNEDDAAARINAGPAAGDIRAYSWMDSFSGLSLGAEPRAEHDLLPAPLHRDRGRVLGHQLAPDLGGPQDPRDRPPRGALGGRPIEVAACFCAQGLFIGVLGTLVGLGVMGFGHAGGQRNDVVLWITPDHPAPGGAASGSTSSASCRPTPSASTIALIIVLTIVISTLAGLLPAWKAARLKPVEALRNE